MFFQAHIAEASAGWHLNLPAELLARAESIWRGQVDDITTSDLHRDVSCMLMRLGRQHENEGLTEDGFFRVDCLIADG